MLLKYYYWVFCLLVDRGLVPPDVSPKFVQDENFKILFTPNKVLAADEMNEEEMESALSEKTGLEKKAIKKDGKESEQRVKATFDWTVVYDEGMEWSHDNRRYFAYFKYLYVGATKNLKIRSYCSTTMIGWSTSNRLGKILVIICLLVYASCRIIIFSFHLLLQVSQTAAGGDRNYSIKIITRE